MAPYIHKNNTFRQQATTPFEKDFFKLLNNSIFGKSIQNNRKQRDVRIITTDEKLMKIQAKPHLKRWEIVEEKLVLVELKRPVIKPDRPLYIGFYVLEMAKVHMYKFNYQVCLLYTSDAADDRPRV